MTQEATKLEASRPEEKEIPAPPPRKRGRTLKILVAAAIVLIVLVAVIFYYLRFIAPFESTDDAFIEGDATPIAPQVAGQVVRLLVRDNQEVNAGDLLLEIDPREYQAKVDQAQASLAAAKSSLEQASALLNVDLAKVAQEKANVIATVAQAEFSAADFQRISIGWRARRFQKPIGLVRNPGELERRATGCGAQPRISCRSAS